MQAPKPESPSRMYSRFQLAKKYLRYYFNASNGKGHGIHSPFVFNFIKIVLNVHNLFPEYRRVELIRSQLLNNNFSIIVEDLGAGSLVSKVERRTIGSIARHAGNPRKYAQLLFRIAQYYQPQTILELGTSLGISSAYMALGNPNARVITIEGSKQISNIAADLFKQLKLSNIELLTGDFDDVLPGLLEKLPSVDLVFIDGNHRKQPTIHYFELLLKKINNNSILVFDDIHWSSEMEEAWEIIKKHPAVRVTIDIFFMGIVFFRDDFKVKQDFVIRY